MFFPVHTNAATYKVSNANDSGTGSLREAIALSDKTEEEDTITFDKEFFSVPRIITLTTGQLKYKYSLTIDGPGAELLTISGNNKSRIFFNNYSNSVLTVKNLTLSQGYANNGGAIYASSFIKISRVVITDNTAEGGADEGSSSDPDMALGGGIYTSGSLTISDSVISNNLATGILDSNSGNSQIGAGGNGGGGGGIYATATVTALVVKCTFINNIARGADSADAGAKSGASGGSARGGALFGRNFHIVNSTFKDNSALGGNGGVTTVNTGGLGGNAYGGAVSSDGARIVNSTFSNNLARGGKGGTSGIAGGSNNGGEGKGGGIYDRTPEAANITLVNNIAQGGEGRIGGIGAGGGFFANDYSISIFNSTITNNIARGGKGMQTDGISQGGGFSSSPEFSERNYLRNNLVAENTATNGTDVYGAFINAFNNLIGIGEESLSIKNGINGNIVGTTSSPVDPKLGPLADNGGFTKTRALLTGSPAIDAGNINQVVNPIISHYLNPKSLIFDQRGYLRVFPIGGKVDIGAFEYGSNTVSSTESPDLQDDSDTGINRQDNITGSSAPVFNVEGVIPGATVELIRDEMVVSTAAAVSFNVSLFDPNPPPDATVKYTVRQIINNVPSRISDPLSVTFDHTSPIVTINQAANQIDPTPTQPIHFTVKFSEPVGGFDSQDISLEGSTADVSAAIISVRYVSSATFDVQVYGLKSPGSVVATVKKRAVYDLVLNYNKNASTSTDNSVSFQPNPIEISFSGKIVRYNGILRSTSIITLTEISTGKVYITRTNPLGFYRFTGIPSYQGLTKQFLVTIKNKTFEHTLFNPITIGERNGTVTFFVP